eukprot:3398995-Alexandrium_andersonii.AAC.1
MGAKVAPSKSLTLASSLALRARWRKHRVRGMGAVMKVAHSIRDLGAQLNVGQVMYAGTINQRFEAAGEVLTSAQGLPAPFESR